MTLLDWAIVVFALALALLGAQRGFVVGALSLAGFVVGAVVGGRFAPLLLHEGSRSPYAPLLALGGAVALGSLCAAGLEGLARPLRRVAGRVPGFGAVDGLLGALLSGALGFLIAWLAGSVALQIRRQPDVRAAIQRSRVLRTLNEVLPPSGPILNALARFDPLPAIRGPRADVAAPSGRVARDPDVRRAGRSVVRILGTACGLGVEGSGWVAGSGLVVTNAHVVAGQDDTTVQPGGTGAKLTATAVAFDPRNDVAVLRVAGLELPRLRLRSEAPSGTAAAVLGYPLNGPFDARPARIGTTRTALSDDAYGNGPVSRRLTPLRGRVRSGNSGGPVVDAHGRVLTTVFAATVGGRRRGGFGVPNGLVRRALRRARAARGAVSTGPCAR